MPSRFFFSHASDISEFCTLSLHDALPICACHGRGAIFGLHHSLHCRRKRTMGAKRPAFHHARSEEHTSELQSRRDLVCRLLLEKKKRKLEHYSFIHYLLG